MLNNIEEIKLVHEDLTIRPRHAAANFLGDPNLGLVGRFRRADQWAGHGDAIEGGENQSGKRWEDVSASRV